MLQHNKTPDPSNVMLKHNLRHEYSRGQWTGNRGQGNGRRPRLFPFSPSPFSLPLHTPEELSIWCGSITHFCSPKSNHRPLPIGKYSTSKNPVFPGKHWYHVRKSPKKRENNLFDRREVFGNAWKPSCFNSTPKRTSLPRSIRNEKEERKCCFEFQPSAFFRHSSFGLRHFPIPNPTNVIRGSQKVEILKKDTQKIIPPWPPRLRVEPIRFREDKSPSVNRID
jgi:hypothetical protein